MDRRQFISVAVSTAWSALAPDASAQPLPGERLTASEEVGQIQKQHGQPPVDGATWYVGEAEGAGLVYGFAPGKLLPAKYLAADLLLDGNTLATFLLAVHEGDKGRVFQFCFGGLYDESALGRYDGENYNIGFFDTCNRPYDALGRAAAASHERMYQVADGQAAPFDEHLEYLPKLFL